MRIGSLFSGIGGLELGLEWAGLGRTVWQVECDPYCLAVLAKHWPDAKQFEDVRAIGASTLAPVDLICGGFPCQGMSSAGARQGFADERSGLWFEFARIVGELLPLWVVVENVASGADVWVNTVRRALAELGYASLPVLVRADALGAPFPRARVFIVARRVADHDGDLQSTESLNAEVAGASSVARLASGAREAADAHRLELRQQPGRRGGSIWQGPPVAPVNRWREPMPAVGGVVPGPTDGLARRAGGNCVVPACAEVVGYVIRELEGW